MAQTYDLTEEKVSKLILRFYFPLLFTNMLQQIYTVADTIIVGKGLGDQALAAVGNMSSLSFLIMGFSMGLTNGFSVSIAQGYGSKNYGELRRTIAAALKLSVGIGVVLSALSIVFLRNLLGFLQTSDLIMKDSLTYGYVLFGGLLATLAYNMCACILRALGDSRTPFIAIIVAAIVNVVLNYVFIFPLQMGVAGAAIATIIAQILSALICFNKLRKIDIIRLSVSDFKSDMNLNIKLLTNGIPMAVMNSITAVGCMVVQYFVNGLGVVYTSAYSACSRYINLFMQPAATAGLAMSSFTSQNYGAKKYERIREGLHVCLGIALISYVVLGSVMFFFPRELALLMLSGEESINLVVEFLPVCGLMIWGVDSLFVFRNGCQGMGKPLVPMISGVAEMIMRIATIVFLVNVIGFKATAYAEVAAWMIALAMNFCAFEWNLRKEMKGVCKEKKVVRHFYFRVKERVKV